MSIDIIKKSKETKKNKNCAISMRKQKKSAIAVRKQLSLSQVQELPLAGLSPQLRDK